MANGLCECGCGQKTRPAPQTSTAMGWVRGQPIRFVRHHQCRLPATSPHRYKIDPETGCWEWLLYRDDKGYGWWSGKAAHRHYYEHLRGPIPAGLQLDHLCRNHGCVNPDHLEPVTHAVNAQRGVRTKLTADEVRAIRRATLDSTAELAKRFGVSKRHVYSLRSGKHWEGCV